MEPIPSPSGWQRFLDRFVPAEERAAALWIAGAAAVLGVTRSLTHLPLQRLVSTVVVSPRADEMGFPLRATAIADLIWAIAVCVMVWAVLRFTRAPKAIALYLVLSGVAVGSIVAGERLALNAVMALAGSTYSRSLWSDLQPIMLTLAETVGIIGGAWLAHLGSPGRATGANGDTLLPALGWEGRPLGGATRLAVVFAATRAVAAVATVLLAFGPAAYQAVLNAQGKSAPGQALGALLFAAPIVSGSVVLFLVGYLGVARFGLPRSAWLVFVAVAVPALLATVRYMPSQIAALGDSGGAVVLTLLLGLETSAGLLLLPLAGVALATRPPRTSVPSDTLPAEDNDHW